MSDKGKIQSIGERPSQKLLYRLIKRIETLEKRVQFLSGGGGGGLANVVEDLTPQLGGELDVNGKNIIGANINLHTVVGGIAVQISGSTFYFNRPIKMYQHNVFDIGADAVRVKDIYTTTIDVANGATGSFTSNDAKTVTVTKGIITAIV